MAGDFAVPARVRPEGWAASGVWSQICYRDAMTLARIAALALALSLAACGGTDKPWHATDITGSMPKLQFRMLRANDASMVSEQNYRGKVVILYFGYTHCPDVC